MPGANNPRCRLTVANRLWGQRGYGFTDSFLTITRERFGADLTEVEFAQPDAVCRAVNAWANEKTAGNIRQIVGPDAINNSLRFVLTDAVYFKGEWSERFDPPATTRLPFFRGDETTHVSMMRQVASCRYGIADNVQILEKPYRGGQIVMMLLLPSKQPEAFGELERLLSAEKVEKWSSSLMERRVRVYLPRFTLEAGLTLAELLPSMGMPRVFRPGEADLSGVNAGKEPLWLSAALHQAIVKVDEEGTEAAAATTGGTLGGPAAGNRDLPAADRPFVFLIRDTRTGAILFLGRLMKPK